MPDLGAGDERMRGERLARRILEYDDELEALRRKRADCVAAWEKQTGRIYFPGPPNPPEPPDERPVS